MKTKTAPRRSELLREFFACAVVIAAIKSGEPSSPVPQEKSPATGLVSTLV